MSINIEKVVTRIFKIIFCSNGLDYFCLSSSLIQPLAHFVKIWKFLTYTNFYEISDKNDSRNKTKIENSNYLWTFISGFAIWIPFPVYLPFNTNTDNCCLNILILCFCRDLILQIITTIFRNCTKCSDIWSNYNYNSFLL